MRVADPAEPVDDVSEDCQEPYAIRISEEDVLSCIPAVTKRDASWGATRKLLSVPE